MQRKEDTLRLSAYDIRLHHTAGMCLSKFNPKYYARQRVFCTLYKSSIRYKIQLKNSIKNGDDRFNTKYYTGPAKKLTFSGTSVRNQQSLHSATLFANDCFIGVKLNYS